MGNCIAKEPEVVEAEPELATCGHIKHDLYVQDSELTAAGLGDQGFRTNDFEEAVDQNVEKIGQEERLRKVMENIEVAKTDHRATDFTPVETTVFWSVSES